MRAFARLDRVGFTFILFLLVLLFVFHVSFERAASDGRSYFVQLRSLVMDGDLDLANDEATFGGQGADKYAFGAPVLWSPFYVLGHLWLRGLNLMGGNSRRRATATRISGPSGSRRSCRLRRSRPRVPDAAPVFSAGDFGALDPGHSSTSFCSGI